jgi:eukaryotic-like serine/threonine-protein kinase
VTHAHAAEIDGVAPPLEAGTSLAPGYRVLAHLGRGGVSDLYDTWSDSRYCRCIAKVVRPDRANDPAARRRVLREGHRLSRLAHLHLVRAYEVIEQPRPVIILETLGGVTLEYLIEHQRRHLSTVDVVRLGLHLCSAMHYLHGQRLLHLDLKPANIVCDGGLAKVLDLDIARPPGRSCGEGTRQYMAPEQVRRELLTPATDVWGLGTVLFEAATHRLPFDFGAGPRYPQLESRATPIRALRRIPPTVAALIDATLEPEPRRRPSIDDLYAELASWIDATVGDEDCPRLPPHDGVRNTRA